MQIKNKANELILEIDNNKDKKKEDWAMWSAKFNRPLRNMISCGSTEEKELLRKVFSYWQTVNNLKLTKMWDFNRIAILIKKRNSLKREMLNEA